MATNSNALKFPTNDKVITLNLTFLEFDVITNCMFALSSDLEGLKRRGVELDNDQEILLKMINGTLRLVHEQAKTSSQNLDPDRVAKELDYSIKVIQEFFTSTYIRMETKKLEQFLAGIKNRSAR